MSIQVLLSTILTFLSLFPVNGFAGSEEITIRPYLVKKQDLDKLPKDKEDAEKIVQELLPMKIALKELLAANNKSENKIDVKEVLYREYLKNIKYNLSLFAQSGFNIWDREPEGKNDFKEFGKPTDLSKLTRFSKLDEAIEKVKEERIIKGIEPLYQKKHKKRVNSIVFSPDGKYVGTASADKTAQIWNALTGEKVGEALKHEGNVLSMAFSPDGKYVGTASNDGRGQIWNPFTGEKIGEPLKHEDAVTSIAFSPDGNYVGTASFDYTAQLWNPFTGEKRGEPLKHEGFVFSIAFSSDGKYVGSASHNKIAQVWNALTGEKLGKPLEHKNSVLSIVFSPDGKYVGTASSDGSAQIWNFLTGEKIGKSIKNQGWIHLMVFSPDGKYIGTASDDGTAQILKIIYLGEA